MAAGGCAEPGGAGRSPKTAGEAASAWAAGAPGSAGTAGRSRGADSSGGAGGAGGRGISIRGAVAATVLASFFWGASFPVSKNVLQHIDPYSLALARFAVAVLVALAVLAVVHRCGPGAAAGDSPALPPSGGRRGSRRRGMTHAGLNEGLGPRLRALMRSPVIWALGALNAGGFLCQNVALVTTTAINVSLLVNVNVVVVAVMSVAFMGDRLGPKGVAGVVLGALGVFLLTTGGDLAIVGEGRFRGDMFGLAAGLIWSVYIVLTKVALDRRKKGIPPLAGDPLGLTLGVSVTTTVALLIPWLVLSGVLTGGLASAGTLLAGPVLLSVLYLGVFSVVVAFFLWHVGLKRLPAWASSVVLLCEVMFASIIAMLWLGEMLGPVEALGGILIMLGIFMAERGLRSSARS